MPLGSRVVEKKMKNEKKNNKSKLISSELYHLTSVFPYTITRGEGSLNPMALESVSGRAPKDVRFSLCRAGTRAVSASKDFW